MTIDTQKIKHWLHKLRHVKTWQLLVVLVFMVLISASLLRLNNLNMVDHRKAVAAADKTGDKAKIKQQLMTLQRYVSGHMNTGLGSGIYLEDSYERDRSQAIDQVSQSTTNPASEVYKQASVECRSRFQGGVESYRNDYVTCVQQRVASLGAAGEVSTVRLPQAENYHYNFASPLWSFDLAGIAVGICVLIILIIFSRWIVLIMLTFLLKHRFKSI